MIYFLTQTCTFCGFQHTTRRAVHGDFDGWDDADRRMAPEECPFCRHARKLAETAPQVLVSYRHAS
jgi:hypothetical protein